MRDLFYWSESVAGKHLWNSDIQISRFFPSYLTLMSYITALMSYWPLKAKHYTKPALEIWYVSVMRCNGIPKQAMYDYDLCQ